MINRKICGLSLIAVFAALSAQANTPPVITNVRAEQRKDTKLVDIYYDVADADNDALKVRIEISDNDGKKYSVPAFTLTGDIGEGVVPGTGKHIVWDAGTDWNGEYSDQMRVKVFAIDAQGFPGMEWGNEVPPGGFLMGQDGGAEGSGPSRHIVIPWSYWLSKYEITNQQYCDFLNAALAAGKVRRDGTTAVYSVYGMVVIPYYSLSTKLLDIGDSHDIRWNVNKFEVVGGYSNFPIRVTWHGAMMFAHFYGYDLPTEAEWEKAARGPDYDDEGEHLAFPWGNEMTAGCANYDHAGNPYDLYSVPSGHGTSPVGYYNGNQIPIGNDMANGYGLYDVCGNVSEWTLSLEVALENYPQQENILSSVHDLVDQKGGNRVHRGGSYDGGCYSPYNGGSFDFTRLMTYYRNVPGSVGFRIVRRKDVNRPAAICEISEDFESWSEKTEYWAATINAETGIWKLEQYSYLYVNSENAASGEKYICSNGFTIPKLHGRLVEVRLKVKNPKSSVGQIVFQGSNSAMSQLFTIQKQSGYTLVCISPECDSDEYRIGAGGLYVDDIELWTIPRENQESGRQSN